MSSQSKYGPPPRKPGEVDLKAPILATPCTVAQIFSDEYRLVLPYFQRGYAWQQEHAARLLSDILRVAEGGADIDWYPLGSIIVAKKPKSPEAWLADGHQRLITLTILIAILRDLEGDPALKARLHSCIFSGGSADPDPQFRLTTHEKARDRLRSAVQAEGATGLAVPEGDEDASESEENIVANRDHLRKAVAELSAARRQRLARFLLEGCFLLVTMLEEQRIALLLFSTMHDTGLKPTTIDLFKAQVLGRVLPHAREACQTIWEQLEAQLGQSGLDALFRHIAVLETGRMPTRPVLAVLQDRFDLDEAEGARSFVTRRLNTVGGHFTTLLDAPARAGVLPPAVSRRLQYLGWVRQHNSWAVPALHWLARSGGNDQQTPAFFRRLEALAWVQMIRAEDAPRRDQRYISLVEQISAGQAFAAGGGLDISAQERRDVRRILSASNFWRKRYKPFLLLRINAAIEGDDQVRLAPEATIEHVYPQNPDHSSQWTTDFRGAAEASRFRNLLGNLTLLTVDEQNEARNHDFVVKRPVLAASTFALSRRLGSCSTWRPDDVGRSTDEMIELLLQSWGIA